MTLTEIRRRLDELGVHPSRRLGQNFLHDQNLAQRIVALAEIPEGAPILEIGPGLGALTEFLPPPASRLTLMEKDRRLAGFLRERFPKARLIEGDAMDEISHFSSLKAERAARASHFSGIGVPNASPFPILNSQFSIILGNLPYSVASPIMVRLAEADLRPQRMVFTIQLEVAQRMTASPGGRDYGLLTLLIRPFYDVRLARRLPASVFWPQPEVASAVIVMERRAIPAFSGPADEARFRDLAKRAFQTRRKKLGALLGNNPGAAWARDRRPEELDIPEWIALAAEQGRGEGQSPHEIFDVVDEHDQVTGQSSRGEVHRQGLRHRAVHIFLWNARGDILLQKRSALKDVAPNTWDSSAAGHLNSGEEYDAAAAREIVEELGVTVPLRRLQKFKAVPELGLEFVHLYEGQSEGPFRFPPEEISAVRWWTPTEVDAAIASHPETFAASFRHLWQATRA